MIDFHSVFRTIDTSAGARAANVAAIDLAPVRATPPIAQGEARQLRRALLGPFCAGWCADDPGAGGQATGRVPLPTTDCERENVVVWFNAEPASPSFVLAANRPAAGEAWAGCGGVSFYAYDRDGSNRREEISDSALDKFRAHYGQPTISKWSIFDYVYGLLHHPGYRATSSGNGGRALPPIPFAPDFRAIQRAGQA